MKGLGGLLVLFGAGSIVLNLMGREFQLLMWIDTWGEGGGWAIKIALILLGAGLWLMGGAKQRRASP